MLPGRPPLRRSSRRTAVTRGPSVGVGRCLRRRWRARGRVARSAERPSRGRPGSRRPFSGRTLADDLDRLRSRDVLTAALKCRLAERAVEVHRHGPERVLLVLRLEHPLQPLERLLEPGDELLVGACSAACRRSWKFSALARPPFAASSLVNSCASAPLFSLRFATCALDVP